MSESSHITKISVNNAKSLSGPGLKIVKFWASWCGPCITMAPVVDDLAAFYASADNKEPVTFYSIDIEEAEALAQEYGISAVPTLVALRDGKVVDRKVGSLTKSQLQSWISSLLQ